MNEVHTVKRIDNSRLTRPPSPHRFREYARLILFGALLAAGCFAYGWQYFQCLELRYTLEELKAERAQMGELNAQLKLEAAALRAPARIDAIARRELGLTLPVPEHVGTAAAPADAVLAARRTDAATR
jgi:cell division protein FtsL